MIGSLDIAEVAALAGDPARAAMLMALLDGRARTAGELAYFAAIKPPTASEHLARLAASNLLAVTKTGRNRYYRLANATVAHMLEGIMEVAALGPGRHQPKTRASEELRTARTCYDHMAGRLGVAIADALTEGGHVVLGTDGGEVTDKGLAFLRRFGTTLADPQRTKRAFCRACVDWTERRPHIAGAVGAALADRAFALGWIARQRDSRALTVTAAGRDGFRDTFGVELAQRE